MCISLQTLIAFVWGKKTTAQFLNSRDNLFMNAVYGQLLAEEMRRGLGP